MENSLFIPDEIHNQDITLPGESDPTAPGAVSPTPSFLTLPLGKNLSLWHEESCRPVLLDFMQNRTMLEVERFTKESELLEAELFQYLSRELKGRRGDMHFLDLVIATERRDSKRGYTEGVYSMNLSTLTSSASSSLSSLNSISSQVSNSQLDEVQQSIMEFLKAITEAREELLVLEKGRVWSKLGKLSVSLKGNAKGLDEHFKALKSFLQKTCDTEHIGYSDLGLELNEYNRKYREVVLNYLRTARKSDGRPDVLSRLFPGSRKLQNWRDKYSDLNNFMESMQKSVQESVSHGIATKDAFLIAGLAVMDTVAQKVANRNEITIFDTYCEEMVVQRLFKRQESRLKREMDKKLASDIATGKVIRTQSFAGWMPEQSATARDI